MKKKLAILIIALAVIALAVLVFVIYDDLLGGIFPALGKELEGTWSVKESYPGSLTSDFSITVKNVSKDSTYELYVRGVKIGERVSIELYIRSLSIVFTKPEEMEVWFYRNESDSEPFIKAKCHETGLLIFPGTQIPPAPVQESGNGDETSTPEGNAPGGGSSGGSAAKQDPPGGNVPLAGSNSGNGNSPGGSAGQNNSGPGLENGEPGGSTGGGQGDDNPGDDIAGASGSWTVEDYDVSNVLNFKINVDGIQNASYYELYANSIIVGNRVPINGFVRSISLMFKDPLLLEVRFFSSSTGDNLVARARCEASGQLVFIKE